MIRWGVLGTAGIAKGQTIPGMKQAREMFQKARETGVFLMEAFAYLHSPWVKAIKAEVDAGTIGKIRYMESEFLTSDYDPSNIRMQKETLGGGMYDLGCYTTSMIGTMMGRQPDVIKAISIRLRICWHQKMRSCLIRITDQSVIIPTLNTNGPEMMACII